jgi:imidazolonepropionase
MAVTGPASRKNAAIGTLADCELKLSQFLARAKNLGVALQDIKTGFCASNTALFEQWQLLCQKASKLQQIEIHPAFFGLNYSDRAKQGMANFLEGMLMELPQIAQVSKKQGISAAVDVNLDLDCFTKELADKWLAAASQHGLDAMIHADRSSRSGGAELAVELARRLEQKKDRLRGRARVLSVSNAKYSSETDLTRLAQHGVGVVILPTQNEFRNAGQNDAGRMRASGVRVAIGSGFDPLESPFHNLWYSAYLALTQCGFSLPEVLGGVTREAAFALGFEEDYGRIQVGKPANLIAFTGDEPEDFMGSPLGENLVWTFKS